MQRFAKTVLRQSSRSMGTEAKSAADTVAAATSKAAPNTATKAASEAPKVVKTVNAPNAPKAPSAPKKSGKGKTILLGSVVAVIGFGGLYRYHNVTDHLSCISHMKGGDKNNILETLYLVPKGLEGKYDDYQFNTYCDRLINELIHINPMDFKTMQDVIDFFGRWFSTLGIDVDMKAPVTEESLLEMFSEFSKQDNMFNIFIIGERYFGVSPMTDYMMQSAARFFDSQRKKQNGEFVIPVDKVIELVKEMQEKTKVTYYSTAFVPNVVNKMFSGDARSVKKEELLKSLEKKKDGKIGVYDFVKMMGVIERQNRDRKFYFYMEDIVERNINDSLFDHSYDNQDKEVEEEIPVKEEESDVVVVSEKEEMKEEVDVEIESESEEKEASYDELLSELDAAYHRKYERIVKADFKGYYDAVTSEAAARKELKKMDWW